MTPPSGDHVCLLQVSTPDCRTEYVRAGGGTSYVVRRTLSRKEQLNAHLLGRDGPGRRSGEPGRRRIERRAAGETVSVQGQHENRQRELFGVAPGSEGPDRRLYKRGDA